mgnify:CR=1 FL=1
MAITDKKTGVWGLDQTYNKINQGSIWDYSGSPELWAWGDNEFGGLGVNNRTVYSSPIQISTDATWKFPPSGGSHTCLLYTSPSPRDQRGSRMAA